LRQSALAGLAAETLTRLNATGAPEPSLAVSWSSDNARRRWRFRLRRGVTLHDGSPLTPGLVAERLLEPLKNIGLEVAAAPDLVTISSTAARRDLPVLLSDPAFSIPGTGPFQKAGENTFTAFEHHWAGRPYLDQIELLPPRAGAASSAAAEAWEIPVGPGRRNIPEGLAIWSSAPAELIAIELEPAHPSLASALSVSVERESMVTALTQRLGTAAGSLLPGWMTGYSFLFAAGRDLTRARALLSAIPPGTVALAYDTVDPLARIVAERVSLNARDAGLSIQVRSAGPAQLRLVRRALNPNAAAALEQLGRRPEATHPESLYAAERDALAQGHLVPLMHLPLVFGFAKRVQLPTRREHRWPRLPIADMWLTQ
jgi:hypothetical protein